MIKDEETAAASLSPNYEKQAREQAHPKGSAQSVTGARVVGETGAALCLGERSGGCTAHLTRSRKLILSHLGKHKEGSIRAELVTRNLQPGPHLYSCHLFSTLIE